MLGDRASVADSDNEWNTVFVADGGCVGVLARVGEGVTVPNVLEVVRDAEGSTEGVYCVTEMVPRVTREYVLLSFVPVTATVTVPLNDGE